ncbi:MAG: UDP-N-acetylglucosamine 2-epimerase (non-hydrolyzing) [Myxococcaceae bacterium]
MGPKQRNLLFVLGTRPEAIKLAPVINAFAAEPDHYSVKLCATGQHRQMLAQTLEFFGLVPDYDLELMKPGQTLFEITTGALEKMSGVFAQSTPDLVFVQGDTTTAFAGALAAAYEKIPIAHVEAGLRTWQKHAPFPEEMNRALISRIADLHFAPTPAAVKNLAAEGIQKNVFCVGNTVIDALLSSATVIRREYAQVFAQELPFIRPGTKTILVTGHRRESFGEPFEAICRALRTIIERFPELELVYPVHLNPNVREPVNAILGGVDRVHLLPPVEYPKLVWLMSQCHLVLTDSGGIQEEAPSLGKPVLVMREVTERTEGIEAGCAQLVGTTESGIVEGATRLLTDEAQYRRMARARNPYGDGTASAAIVGHVAAALS